MLRDQGGHALLMTWLGDAANEAIACLLTAKRIHAYGNRLGVEITKSERSISDLEDALSDIASEPAPSVDELLAHAENLTREKWDWLLSPHLLRLTYATSSLDLEEAMDWLGANFSA